MGTPLLARKSRCYFLTSTFSLFIGYLYLLFSAESKENKKEEKMRLVY